MAESPLRPKVAGHGSTRIRGFSTAHPEYDHSSFYGSDAEHLTAAERAALLEFVKYVSDTIPASSKHEPPPVL